MQKRRRTIQSDNLEVRLANRAQSLRAEAKRLAPGPKREELLLRAQQCEDGAHMTEWLRPGEVQSQR